jgi:MYXO-CTERM domain-containing protein
MLNGSGLEYIFNHVQVPYSADSWNTEYVDNATDLFSLYGSGAPGGGISKTLLDWSTDPTWGSVIFGDTTNAIMRVGFNIGSSQRNGLAYMDWMSTSLMGGELNDFQAEAVVPEPASVAIWSLLGVGALVAHRRSRRKKS